MSFESDRILVTAECEFAGGRCVWYPFATSVAVIHVELCDAANHVVNRSGRQSGFEIGVSGGRPVTTAVGLKRQMIASALKSSVYPQFFPAHWLSETCEIVHSPFPSRVRIGYVVRGDGSYSYLMAPEFRDSGLSRGALHEAALSNLRALRMPSLSVAQTPGGPEAYLCESEDNFTAARILLPVVQRELQRVLGEEFLVALPSRDWMFCWSRGQSPSWQERNASEAFRIFSADEYNLTPDILLFRGNRFCVHQHQDIGA